MLRKFFFSILFFSSLKALAHGGACGCSTESASRFPAAGSGFRLFMELDISFGDR